MDEIADRSSPRTKNNVCLFDVYCFLCIASTTEGL